MFWRIKLLAGRVRGWLTAQKMDDEFVGELDAHLELLTTELVRRGSSPKEARRMARMKLGGITQLRETHREAAGLPAVESFFQDLRYAARSLRNKPGFAIACILILGLGIGVTAAIFSVVHGVLLRPLPYPNSSRLVRIEEIHPGSSNSNFTYASYLDLDRRSGSMENISAYRPWNFNLTGEGEPEEVAGALVSENFFPALGSQPILGRAIREEDDRPGGDNHVVILSNALWQRKFGSDRGILDKMLRISGEDYRVIGVMPEGFHFPDMAKLWCPLVARGDSRNNRRAHLLAVLANLRSGTSLGGAQAELAVIAKSIERQNPGIDPTMQIAGVSLQKSLVEPVRPALLILMFAVGLLLLLACVNLANLMLARAETRQKEFAIRLAIGAARVRLVRQLLTESLMITVLGAVLGLGITYLLLRFIVALNADSMPRFREISMDWRVTAFVLIISLTTGFLFGLAPALVGTRTDLAGSMKENGSVLTGRRLRGSSRPLVALQFAIAVVLLVGAGLVGNSFVRLLKVNPGFDQNNVLAVTLFFSPDEFPNGDPKGPLLLRQILENVRGVRGLESAGMVNALPITGGPATDFAIVGRPVPAPDQEPSADIRTVDAGYFHTMRIPFVAGREFTEHDDWRSRQVMIINQTMARLFWPNENPIGQHVTMKDWGPPLTGEIVGVVGDVKPRGLDAEVGAMIYWPYAQFPLIFNTIVVRSADDSVRLLPAVKSAIWAVDKNQPISRAEMLDQILSESLARRRLYLILLGAFSIAAMLLAAIGIYGMVSYSVSKRTREIGIRLAMGAERKDLLWMVLGQGAAVALAGIAIGIAGALSITGLMTNLLFGITPSDPLTIAVVAILLLLLALLSSYLPARRATRVDPLVALRYQ